MSSSGINRKMWQFFIGLAIFTILSLQTVQARDDDYGVCLNFYYNYEQKIAEKFRK